MAKSTCLFLGILSTLLILSAPESQAQWTYAQYENVCTDPGNDRLGQSSLALDSSGTLHMIYEHWTGYVSNALYYKFKPLGGRWSAAQQINAAGGNVTSFYLTVNALTGLPYAGFVQDSLIKIATLVGGSWQRTELPVPTALRPDEPSLAIDNNGILHIAFLEYFDFYRVAYGTWDGQSFTMQTIWSALSTYPLLGSTDICIRSNRSVAISYINANGLTHVTENISFGGQEWSDSEIPATPNLHTKSICIRATSHDDLHLIFGAMGLGPPSFVFYTRKLAGSGIWDPTFCFSDPYFGDRPVLALESDGTPHLAYTASSDFTALYSWYATNECQTWAVQYFLSTEGIHPSMVMDRTGNASVIFDHMTSFLDEDIGFYGFVSLADPPPNVDLSFSSSNPSIWIPANGGSFDYTVTIANHLATPQNLDVWINVKLPNSSTYGPVLRPINLTIPAETILSRQRVQVVPGSAPSGVYYYTCYLGLYPDSIWHSGFFTFVKSTTERGGLDLQYQKWSNEGESFSDGVPSIGEDQPSSFMLHEASPNPFNPSTAISYKLRAASHVSLKVYDTGGRLVATLLDGWKEAGMHEVVFDGSGVTGGIYFARLEMEGRQQTKKLVLIK